MCFIIHCLNQIGETLPPAIPIVSATVARAIPMDNVSAKNSIIEVRTLIARNLVIHQLHTTPTDY